MKVAIPTLSAAKGFSFWFPIIVISMTALCFWAITYQPIHSPVVYKTVTVACNQNNECNTYTVTQTVSYEVAQ